MAEKDGDKEEAEIEEGALNVLCSSPSSCLSLFRHKVDEGSLRCLASCQGVTPMKET